MHRRIFVFGFVIIIIASILAYFYQDSCIVKENMTIDNLDTRKSWLSAIAQIAIRILDFKGDFRKYLKNNSLGVDAQRIPFWICNRLNVTKSNFGYRSFWTLKPKNNASDKVVFYIHGNGFIQNIIFFQWLIVDDLITRSNATVIVPDYEVAPFSTFNKTFNFMKELYQFVLKQYPAKNIFIFGDSSGAGFALSFAMALRNLGIEQPNRLLLFSPWLDISLENKEIDAYEPIEPMLERKDLITAGKLFADDIDVHDWRVSPIYGEFHDLAKISIYIGNHDILFPDCQKLHSILISQNIDHSYYVFPNMFHVWPVLPFLRESKIAMQHIADTVNQG